MGQIVHMRVEPTGAHEPRRISSLIVRVSAKTDYAIRAGSRARRRRRDAPQKGERVAAAQGIPLRFLENILMQLRHAGLVESRRGAEGGYRLARPAEEITLADIIRAIDGPLGSVSGVRPEALDFAGSAEPMREVWIAVRAALRAVLEQVRWPTSWPASCPTHVRELLADEDAWLPH